MYGASAPVLGYLRRLRLRLGVLERVVAGVGAAPAACGRGSGARLPRAPRPACARSARSARIFWLLGHGTAVPLVQAGGTPLGPGTAVPLVQAAGPPLGHRPLIR